MRSFIKVDEDASIYQRYPDINTGLDEILEIGKNIKGTDGPAKYSSGSVRTLLNFSIPSGSHITASNFYLNLYLANSLSVNRYQQLHFHLISSSWVEGSGYFYQDVKNNFDGVTWNQTKTNVSWSVAGGSYTPASASYTFTAVPISKNVRIDVTGLLQPIISGSRQNFGIIIKFPTTDETDQQNVGNLKFFSTNTHTVFAPNIELAYNNQTFVTGSLKPIPSDNLMISPRYIKQTYFPGEVDKIHLVVRDRYPDKRFDATQRYRNQYYLPSSSYFRIRDVVSGLEVFKFDEYSTISCDTSGSYFMLDTTGLQLNRYYAIDLKVKTQDETFFPDFNYTFKIETDA